jgi:hypothetical protein
MGQNRASLLLVLVYIAAMSSDCEMVPVIGTVAIVGPVELAESDTTYRYLVIREKDGTCRDFAAVHAIPALSGLIQRDAAGTFLFLDGPKECRLLFVYRHDGARECDFDAMHWYLDSLD